MRVRRNGESLLSLFGAPGLLPRVSSTFSSGEHSVQGKAGALWRKEGMPWMSSRYLPLPACSSKRLLPFLVMSPPGGARRARYGPAAPPAPPCIPPDHPAGSHLACTSLWPGQFLGKTDACHKQLGNRIHAFALWEALALGHGLHIVLFPGEALRANGALGVAKAMTGGAVTRKAAHKRTAE